MRTAQLHATPVAAECMSTHAAGMQHTGTFVLLLPDFKRFLHLDRRVYEARGSIVFVIAQLCKFKMWGDNSEGRQI